MTDYHNSHFVHPRNLKINVGFLLAEGIGYQRVLEFDFPRLRLDEDMELEYLRGALRMSRNSRGILVQADLETGLVTECARCLTPTVAPAVLEIEELFSFPASPDTEYSIPDTAVLDLAPLLREEAILAVPMGMLCRPDCAGLCSECGHNLNEGPCDCKDDEIDPRLAGLRAHLERGDNTD